MQECSATEARNKCRKMELRIPSTPITAEYALEACKAAMTNGKREKAQTWLAVWEELRGCSMGHSNDNTQCANFAETMLAAMEATCLSIIKKFASLAPMKETPWEALVQCAINKCHSAPAVNWLQNLHASRYAAEIYPQQGLFGVEWVWNCITRDALGRSLMAAINANDALAVRIYFRVTTLPHPAREFNENAPADLLWKVITEQFPAQGTAVWELICDNREQGESLWRYLLRKPLGNPRRTIAGAMALLLMEERGWR
jgi:hypothetical protein